MTDPNGWPFPDRPGVPLNPERNRWHWVQEGDWPPLAIRWFASSGWEGGAVGHGLWRYRGLCLIPAEIAAREDEAERRGMEWAAEIADAAAWRCPNAGCTTIATAIRAAAKEIKP